MKKVSLWFILVANVAVLGAQENLIALRRQLFEHGETPQERAVLWKSFKARLYPLTDDILEARLENNLNVLGTSMNLLLVRQPIWLGTRYFVEIAQAAQKHYQFSKGYLSRNKKAPASLRLAYGRLMMMITPIINRTDRNSLFLNLQGFLTQYDELERMWDLARDLVKEDSANIDHWMFLAEVQTLLSNHTTRTNSALANRYFKRVIREYTKLGRREDLAWAYLWQSSLFMRRSLNSNAREAIGKAQDLFPKSFLTAAAISRFNDELPWM